MHGHRETCGHAFYNIFVNFLKKILDALKIY
jgi:hypothetical protein